jgi:hypothetical protein
MARSSSGDAMTTTSSPYAEGAFLSAQSVAKDAHEAAREFHAGVAQPDMEFAIFFCSGEYDQDDLASELGRLFDGQPVVGCTTAGEIGPVGCRDHSISGASFPAGSAVAVTGLLEGLDEFTVQTAHDLGQDLLRQLEIRKPGADATNTFAFLLIDGLSMREEFVTAALQHAIGGIPLVGGSAGDGQRFVDTRVYVDGRFRHDSAVLTLISTTLPFKTFKTQHFVPTGKRAVVTAADPEQRIVREIDGYPAAAYYGQLVGSSADNLGPDTFADDPVVVMIDGTDYVRSIQRADPDGSLKFYCAIEEGLVLRTAQGADLVGNLEEEFAEIRAVIGQPQLVLACDCILRKLEIAHRGLVDQVDAIFRKNNVVGFNSYGEQYLGVHVNQTLTGIAIGEPFP